MTNRAASIIEPAENFIFGLFGAGGFAREVMPIVGPSIDIDMDNGSGRKRPQYFVEADARLSDINGFQSVSESDFFNVACEERYFNIAISDSRLREKIVTACISRGAKPLTIQSPHALIYDQNRIGEGAILCAHTIITSNAEIGKFFHANIFSYVAHDCVIGDYVTLAPNVHCNGNVHIHDHAYIGTGAVLKQGAPSRPLVIGEGAVVGMGAVVTKDVPPFTTVVGNPARPLERR